MLMSLTFENNKGKYQVYDNYQIFDPYRVFGIYEDAVIIENTGKYGLSLFPSTGNATSPTIK